MSVVESITEDYLRNLGLTWSYLNGKRILDAGSGPPNFATAANKKGIEVVSIDIYPEYYMRNGQLKRSLLQNLKFVQGDMTNMPFQDGIFDLVLMHGLGSIDSYFKGELNEDEGDIQLLKADLESIRALKPNGELRIGPIARQGFEFHKKIWPNIAMFEIERRYDFIAPDYYLVFTK